MVTKKGTVVTEIETNERFDKLTNLDISTHYRDRDYWFMPTDFMGAFAYWVVYQSPYDAPDISAALVAFGKYVSTLIEKPEIPERFSFNGLRTAISEGRLECIPEIEILNHPKVSSGFGYDNRHSAMHPDYDFIDLGALAKNVFYMMLRQSITEG